MPLEDSFLRYPEEASNLNRRRADFCRDNIRDGEDMSDDASWRRLRAGYWGNVKFADDMVGTIIDAIDRSGSADRTIVALTTDHGEMIGSRAMLEMRTPYEDASRVPLMMKVPWLQNDGSTIPGNFSHVDLVPALLDLLGQSPSEQAQGSSRAGVLEGTDTLANNNVFVQQTGIADRLLTTEPDAHTWPKGKTTDLIRFTKLPWRCVVTADRWKLTLFGGDDGELYDLNNDPSEFNNLFEHQEHRD